jgi:NADH-quinone oxidoreductase subunit M
MLKERLHTRDIGQMGGLWTSMPSMGAVAMLFTMASLGLPVLGNFIAEFLILMGTFLAKCSFNSGCNTWPCFLCLVFFAACAKGFPGAVSWLKKQSGDFSAREVVIMAALSASIVLLGLYPQPVIDTVRNVVHQLGMK